MPSLKDAARRCPLPLIVQQGAGGCAGGARQSKHMGHGACAGVARAKLGEPMRCAGAYVFYYDRLCKPPVSSRGRRWPIAL